MDTKQAQEIVDGYRGVAQEAVTELEKCLAEHRHYDSDLTLQRVKLSCEMVAGSINHRQSKAKAAQELRIGGPIHRLRLPQATA
jgi:hypothetical protein